MGQLRRDLGSQSLYPGTLCLVGISALLASPSICHLLPPHIDLGPDPSNATWIMLLRSRVHGYWVS